MLKTKPKNYFSIPGLHMYIIGYSLHANHKCVEQSQQIWSFVIIWQKLNIQHLIITLKVNFGSLLYTVEDKLMMMMMM